MPPLARNMQGCVCLCIDQDLTPVRVRRYREPGSAPIISSARA
jgi:hypothetical protein